MKRPSVVRNAVRLPGPDFTTYYGALSAPSRGRTDGVYIICTRTIFSSFCGRRKCHIFLVSLLIYLGLQGYLSGAVI